MLTIPTDTKPVLDELQNVLKHVLQSTHSDFYRNHLSNFEVSNTFPDSLSNWRTLPFLNRDDMTAVSVWNRTFIPRTEVEAIRSTSSTSSKKPIITPRRTVGNYGAGPSEAGIKRQVSFMSAWYMSELSRRGGGGMLMNMSYPETVEDFRFAARLISLFKAESISAFPHLTIQLAQYLKQEGYLEKIKIVEMYGDRCSRAQRDNIKKLYNNPLIFQNYSSSEVAGIFGTSCSHTREHSLVSFHIDDKRFLSEFIDPDSEKPKDPHQPAELVVSSRTTEQPFPLIRYRTGDLFVIEKDYCPCGRGPLFEMVGRTIADRIRFMSGEFSIRWIEEGVVACKALIENDFEAHYFEGSASESEDNIARPYLKIRIKPVSENISFDSIAKGLSEGIYINSNVTYADGVKRRFFLPMIIDILTEPTPTRSEKKVRLFHHLNK